MRQHRSITVFVPALFLLGLAGCAADSMQSTSEPPPTSQIAQAPGEPAQPPSGAVQEPGTVPSPPGTELPTPPAAASEPGQAAQGEPPAGEIQERGLPLKPLTGEIGIVPFQPTMTLLPGEFAILTQKGYYLTALNGGGRATDPTVATAATSAGPLEKFRLAVISPPPPHDKIIQTASGNYVTAVGGGNRTTDVLHTDATQARDWEQFRLLDLAVGNFAPSYYAIQTIKGFYVTAVGAGGKLTDPIHTDATQIKAWEQFRVVKCGDLGSGYVYGLMNANGSFLVAQSAGGRSQGDIGWGGSPAESGARFKLIRQGDGSYGLQTSNGVNFVTALGGGGQVSKYQECHPGVPGACLSGWTTIFHTDATQVRAWEKFRFVDLGNCKYAIQTVSGYYVGIYKDPSGHGYPLTTDRSTISENEKFQLPVFGLESPVVLK